MSKAIANLAASMCIGAAAAILTDSVIDGMVVAALLIIAIHLAIKAAS